MAKMQLNIYNLNNFMCNLFHSNNQTLSKQILPASSLASKPTLQSVGTISRAASS